MMKMMTALMSLGHMVISTNAQTDGHMVGQQVDSHDCVLDGGYQWCESQNKCVRPWLTPCHQYPTDPLPIAIDPIELPRPTDPLQPTDPMLPVPTGPTIPYNCASWYDGCNRCMINEGKIGGCTRMMCFTQGLSTCLAYNRLTEGSTCYRFCEDGSQEAVDLKDKCPSGTTCTPSNSIGFDSCNDNTWKCLNSH